MSARIFVRIGLFALLTVCPSLLAAQAQDQKSQLFWVEEWVANLSTVEEFEGAVKECMDVYKKYNWETPWIVSSTFDFHYYFFAPVDGMAGAERFMKSSDDLFAKWGIDKYQSLYKRWGDFSQGQYKQYFVRSRPDLSYVPTEPRLKPQEKEIFLWDVFYIIPGRENEFEKNWKAIKQLLADKKYNDDVQGYAGGAGSEMPVYVGVLLAKDLADLWTQNKKMWELLGDDGQKYIGEMVKLARNRVLKMGTLRPDLSYEPVKK